MTISIPCATSRATVDSMIGVSTATTELCVPDELKVKSTKEDDRIISIPVKS